MSTFNNLPIIDHGETIHFKLKAKKESEISPQERGDYFPASDTFISGMLELAHKEAVSSFQDFYNNVVNDPEENKEDNVRYLELLNFLKALDMKKFDTNYRMSDTFVRMSIPQPVTFFYRLYNSFIKE